MSFVVEFLGVVGTGVGEKRRGSGGVANGVGQDAVADGGVVEGLVGLTVGTGAVVVVETAGIDGQLAHGVNLVVEVGKEVAAATDILALGGVALIEGGVVVLSPHTAGAVVAAHRPALAGVVALGVTTRGEDVEAQFLLGPHIADPGADERLVGTIDTEADKLVALNMGGGDDVDDRLGVGGIFGRRVGDGLDAGQCVGGQRLQVGFEVLFRQFRWLVVDPNLHAAHTAQGDVTFHVDLHARGILEGVLGGSGLDGGVVADIIYHLLTVHGVERPVGGDLYLLQRGGTLFQFQCAQCGVVFHGEGVVVVAVADGGDAQQVFAGGHAVHLELAVEVRRGTFDKGAVGALQHADVDKGQRFAADAVAQRANHLVGVADDFLTHRILLLLLLVVFVVLSGESTRAKTAGATHRRTAAA